MNVFGGLWFGCWWFVFDVSGDWLCFIDLSWVGLFRLWWVGFVVLLCWFGFCWVFVGFGCLLLCTLFLFFVYLLRGFVWFVWV